ncbi:hypothetical protein KFK09_020292 [Dendrobium nobile]|uniref:Uncharacterized protein n=1 Tax=Dendrobium nobile TaxID=94219 RepID=A0A8T3ASW7_DENNO|nr:hypothetical protein KFK09_020292 [Dendrobium nobile]
MTILRRRMSRPDRDRSRSHRVATGNRTELTDQNLALEFASELNLSNISTQTVTQTQSYYKSSIAAEQNIYIFFSSKQSSTNTVHGSDRKKQNRKAMTVQKSKVQTIPMLIKL